MSYFVFWCGHSRDSNAYYYVTGGRGGGKGSRDVCRKAAYTAPFRFHDIAIVIMFHSGRKCKDNLIFILLTQRSLHFRREWNNTIC